ncbi:MAG: hypothetical protein ABJA98_31010 [Acidobacteriota bacterium]
MKGVARIRIRDGRVRLAELHWYEAHGIGKKEFKRKRFLMASLERHKIYVVLPDKNAEKDGDLRVVDESGEDDSFPAERFVAIDVPAAVRVSLLKAS